MVNIEAVKNKKKNGAHICTTYSTCILNSSTDLHQSNVEKVINDERRELGITKKSDNLFTFNKNN